MCVGGVKLEGSDLWYRRGPRLSRPRVDELKGEQFGVAQLKTEPDEFAFQRGQVAAVSPVGFPPQGVDFTRLGGVARDYFGIFVRNGRSSDSTYTILSQYLFDLENIS